MAETMKLTLLHFAVSALRGAFERGKPDNLGTYLVRMNDFEVKALLDYFATDAGRRALSEGGE